MVGIQLGEELWHMGTYLVVAAAFLILYGSFQQRLTHVAKLFGRLETGDFDMAYDVDADPRPDSITLVGRAYNRVRAQLAGMITTDPVSGCLNQRGLDQQMQREVERAYREGGELAVLAIDIDRFAAVNEQVGQFAGDKVLHDLGRLLRDSARTWDAVARPGHDHFVVLLPETGLRGAREVAVRIHEALRAKAFRADDTTVRLTASIGVAATRMVEANVDQDLLSRAEAALAKAKAGGGDRVETAGE
jgi:diguanylate cyclase (GGDEF)-like protein